MIGLPFQDQEHQVSSHNRYKIHTHQSRIFDQKSRRQHIDQLNIYAQRPLPDHHSRQIQADRP